MKKKIAYTLFLFLVLMFLTPIPAKASDAMLDEIPLEEVEETVESILGEDISFGELVQQGVGGNITVTLEKWFALLKNKLTEEIIGHARNIKTVLLITLIAALFSNFINVFDNPQISEISFYVMNMLLLAVLLQSFLGIGETVSEAIGQSVVFMKALIPAYFLTVSLVTGATTALAFYEFTLILIAGVQWIMLYVGIPAIHIYLILGLINHLSKEDYLSKLGDLLGNAISWMLKSCLTIVIGYNVVQGLITPVVDSLRNGMVQRTARMIPGLGNGISVVTEVVLGTSVLIKNGVGAAALLMLMLICLVPLLKVGIYVLLYKFSAAVIQPVADRRMMQSVECVGEGAVYLFRILFTTIILFFITIAIVAVSTNRGF